MTTPSKELLALRAGDVMTRNVIMVPREMSLQGAARLLARACVTGAPVVDANGCCIGVISNTDFMHSVEKDRPHGHGADESEACMCKPWQIPDSVIPICRVEDYMTRDPVLVPIGTKIGDVARMMMDAHIHRVIVVEPMGRCPLGVISSMDILAAVARAEQADVAPARGATTSGVWN